MFQLQDVVLQYDRPEGDILTVLDHINLHIAPGERWAVIGPSGCGKSSMLHVLAGLQTVTSGSVQYQGAAHTKPHGEISVILQEYGLFYPAENFRKAACRDILHTAAPNWGRRGSHPAPSAPG